MHCERRWFSELVNSTVSTYFEQQKVLEPVGPVGVNFEHEDSRDATLEEDVKVSMVGNDHRDMSRKDPGKLGNKCNVALHENLKKLKKV